jgi:predicted nucleotidyltransferase
MGTIAESLLDEVVHRLAVEFVPDQIIIFGSHAWGTLTEDSDLDLLVIVPQSDSRPTERARRAHRCLRGLLVPMDVIVKTREEMERFGRVPASLEAEILERGKIVYGRGKEGTGPGLTQQGVA